MQKQSIVAFILSHRCAFCKPESRFENHLKTIFYKILTKLLTNPSCCGKISMVDGVLVSSAQFHMLMSNLCSSLPSYLKKLQRLSFSFPGSPAIVRAALFQCDI